MSRADVYAAKRRDEKREESARIWLDYILFELVPQSTRRLVVGRFMEGAWPMLEEMRDAKPRAAREPNRPQEGT